MAVLSFNSSAREGVAPVELVGWTLVVRSGDGFEVGFESLDDVEQVKATTKDAAPDLADAIDAAFA
jgi:hypothetical protein